MSDNTAGLRLAATRIGQKQRRRQTAALLFLVGGGALTSQSLVAQEVGEPNPHLTFSLSQSLSLDSNPGLKRGVDSVEAALASDFGVTLITETPISSLAFSGQASLRFPFEFDESEDDSRLDGPRLALSYNRAVPSASVTLDANIRRSDISFLRSLQDFVDDDGILDLPDDIDELEGEGTRLSSSISADLTLRDDRPFGFELSAELDHVGYEGVTSESLVDRRSASIASTLRFDITEVAQLRTTLRSAVYEEDRGESVTTTGLDVEGFIERPTGRVSATVSLRESDDGLRTSLSFGRAVERPLGVFSGQLGLSSGGDGDISLIGDLDIRRDLPNGSVALSFEQEVAASEDGSDELATSVSARWSRELTPLVGLNFDALYSSRLDPGTDEGTRDLEIGAALGRAVTRDWSLAAGYRLRVRVGTEEERATSHSLFLTLSRSFRTGL